MKFDDIINEVLESEGGSRITKDPLDAGGTTKYGISQRAYPKLDIEKLTEQEAKNIYHLDYWIPSKASKVPAQIREIYFDMVVNFGQRSAVKVLQQACNGKNTYDIKVDGLIGNATIGACKKPGARSVTCLPCFKVCTNCDQETKPGTLLVWLVPQSIAYIVCHLK